MFRLLNERPRGILRILKMRTVKYPPEPGVLTMSIHTGSTGKASNKFRPSGYVSAARGESVCNLVTSFLSYNDIQIRPLTQPRLDTDRIRGQQSSTSRLRVGAGWEPLYNSTLPQAYEGVW